MTMEQQLMYFESANGDVVTTCSDMNEARALIAELRGQGG